MMTKTSNIKLSFAVIYLSSDTTKALDVGNHNEGKVTSESEYNIEKSALVQYSLGSIINTGDRGLEGSLSGTTSNIKLTEFIVNFISLCNAGIELLTNMYQTNNFKITLHTFESIGEDRAGPELLYRAVEDVILNGCSIKVFLIIKTNKPILIVNGKATDTIVEFRLDANDVQIDVINKEGRDESVDSVTI